MKPARRSAAAARPAVSFDPFAALSASTFLVACALPVVAAFFPDERLVRIKLLGLESGVLAMAALTGAQLLLSARSRPFSVVLKIAAAPLLFVAIQFALWWTTPEQSLASVEMRRVVLTASSFLVFALCAFSPSWRRRWLWTWTMCAALVAVYGVLQKNGGVGILLVPLMERPIGTFGNPIFFAAYLLISLFVALQCAAEAKTAGARLLGGAAILLMAGALVLVKTRAAWIGCVAAMAAGVWMAAPNLKRKIIFLVGGLIAAAAFAAAMRSTLTRDQSHLLIWRDTIAMWKVHPWVGVGLGTFHVHFPDYAKPDLLTKWPRGSFIINDAHNEFLQQLAEGGVVGFFSWLLIPLFFVWTLIAHPVVRRQHAWLCAGVLGLAVQNFFSVDMRFGVSASLAAQVMGLVVGFAVRPPNVPLDGINKERDTKQIEGITPRAGVSAGLWILLLGFFVLPCVLQPYRAQKSVQATPDFFDQRLLEPAKTISDLGNLAVLYPTEPAVLEKLAYVYAKEIQTPDKRVDAAMAAKAVATYEKILAIDPSRVAVYNNLANIEYTLGRTDQAMDMWRAALQHDPHFIDARLNLGKILYTKGQLKAAAEQFDAVLKDDPGNAEATVYLKRMVE